MRHHIKTRGQIAYLSKIYCHVETAVFLDNDLVCACQVFLYLFAADERVSFLVTDVDSRFRADVPPLVMQDIE